MKNTRRLRFYRFAMSVSCTLLIGTLLAIATDTHAIGTLERLHCDYVFSESHFVDIERKDYPRCEKRWDYLTKQIVSTLYQK